MKKYEYKRINLYREQENDLYQTLENGVCVIGPIAKLNQLGQQGWRAFNPQEMVVFFERVIEE